MLQRARGCRRRHRLRPRQFRDSGQPARRRRCPRACQQRVQPADLPMNPRSEILRLEPVPRLIERTGAELSAEFDFAKPMRVSRAPGRLDVMGGIADYTGSLVCEMPLDRAAAVLLQERASDRELQIFSFNLYDEHQPFTFRISLAGLAPPSIA